MVSMQFVINKIQGIQIPKPIQYFDSYDLSLHLSATLFDTNLKKFIGWTYWPENS